MAETIWNGIVSTKPTSYANGDQKVTIRVQGASPVIVKGDALTLVRGTPDPSPSLPPIARLTLVSVQTDGNCTVSTSGTSAVSPATLQSWTLAWGDGQTDGGPGAPPASLTHQYGVSGSYALTLTVKDSNNMTNMGSLTASITVTPPTPLPLPPPPPPPPAPGSYTLLGGWQLAVPYARGGLAIDFDTMTCYLAGTVGGNVVRFALPPMGAGTNPATWPVLSPDQTLARWWPDLPNEGVDTYPSGLLLWHGKLWTAPRVFYAAGTPSPTTGIYAQDGEVQVFNLPRQKFAGFVKRGPGLDPFLGCGGYESGGSVQSSGPTLATMASQVLIEYQWPADPGPVQGNGIPLNWNLRAPRDTNYSVDDPGHEWVGWTPRLINGVLEGRWTVDNIFGGGLALPDGITYWPYAPTGALSYAAMQNGPINPLTYVYKFNPSTYQFVSFANVPDFADGPVLGQELGPDGKVYLAQGGRGGGGSPFSSRNIHLYVYG